MSKIGAIQKSSDTWVKTYRTRRNVRWPAGGSSSGVVPLGMEYTDRDGEIYFLVEATPVKDTTGGSDRLVNESAPYKLGQDWVYDEIWGPNPPPGPGPAVVDMDNFEARFTSQEWNAATDYVYEVDLVSGKPKRRALMQGLQRATARNSVDLEDARTIAFMDNLVSSGIITSQRKDKILAP